MGINTSKVLVGGLAAGLVMNIIGFVGNGMLLGPRMQAEMQAAAPTLTMPMSAANIFYGVATQFIVGIILVWLYASMRPRFGPGYGTAVKGAIVIWLLGDLFYQDWVHVGLMRPSTFVMAALVALVSLLAGSWVGGKLYSEPGATS